MRTTVLAHHYHLIPRPPEQVIVKKEENWDLDYLASEQNQGKKRKEVNTGEVTVICPWSQVNLVEEPEVRSKFLGYSHSHYVANGDENDNNELNSDFKT